MGGATRVVKVGRSHRRRRSEPWGFGVFHLMAMLRAFVGQRPDQAHLALVGLQGLTQRREDPMLVFRSVETGFAQPGEKLGLAAG